MDRKTIVKGLTLLREFNTAAYLRLMIDAGGAAVRTALKEINDGR